ncbi:coat protein [Colletotrichum navitas totivirus 1]|nr:coat protein [Colletotrichum navitas totivirus 1]
MDSPLITSLLTGIIAAPVAGYLTENQYRRYRSAVTTTTNLGGRPDPTGKTILYEVGTRYKTKEKALAVNTGLARAAIVASYPTSSVLRDDFLGLAKKYSNFSATFEYSSLAPLAERIAKGLAITSVFEGGISSSDLCAGQPLAVTALGTHATPINAAVNTVFIPRLVDSVVSPDVFAVLVAASASMGAAVVTDVLALDGNNVPIVPTVNEEGFHDAAIHALRLIGANMISCDQGPLFALAVTRGIHQALSVVGHTDEGGITRDLLRCADHAPPFGGIHTGLVHYSALPGLSTGVIQNVAAYVDSIALVTAAAVGHCDPCVSHNDAVFPTVLLGTKAGGAFADPGDSADGDDDMARRNRGQYLDSLPSFAEIYVSSLGTIFGAAGQVDVAVRFLTAAGNYLSETPRHLKYPSVAPFFWIEPTSLLPRNAFSTRAELNGFGSLGGRDHTSVFPLFEAAEVFSQVGEFRASYVVSARSARTVPFLYHWVGNPMNGLGAVVPIQLDPQGIVHPGPDSERDDVEARLEKGSDWAGYLWTRGQSPFPAPSEFINTNSYMGIRVNHAAFDDDGNVILEHLPTPSEMVSGTLQLTASSLMGIPAGKSNAPPRQVARARTRAAAALAAVRRRSRRAPESSVVEMALAFTTPSLKKMTVSATVPTADPSGEQLNNRRPSDLGPTTGGPRFEGNPPAPPAPQHEKYGAPRPVQGRAVAGGGGGVAPAPPQPSAPVASPPSSPPPTDILPVEPAPGATHPAGPTPLGDA